MQDLFHVQVVRLRKDCENLKSEEDLVSVVFDFLKQANLMTPFSAFLTINHFGNGVLYGNSEFSTQLISEQREQILSRFEKMGNVDFRHRQLMLFIEERNSEQSQIFEVEKLVIFPMVLENKLEGALLVYSPTGILPDYDKYQLVSWVFQEQYFMISRKHQSLLYKKMEAMNEAREMIYCVMSIDDMLSILGDIVLNHAKADMAFLALYEGESRQIAVRASWNSSLDKIAQTRISHFERDFPDNLPSVEIEDKGNMFELAKSSAAKILKLNSVKLLRSDNPDIIDILIPEMLFIPLVIRERQIGFLCVIRRMFAREKISDTDISILETIISLAASSIENNRLYEQTLKEQMTQKELQVAQSIQMGLQAKIKPELRNFQIFAMSLPARVIGGDYYDFFPLESSRLVATLTDIVGKGIPAALIMAFFKGIMQSSVFGQGGPSHILSVINENLCKSKSVKNYIPSVFGLINDDDCTLTYANAGHEPPLYFHAGTQSFKVLDKGGLPLGAMMDSSYEQESLFMEPGDIVMMCTDGITEARNKEGVDYGPERVRNFVRQYQSMTAEQFVDKLSEEILSYSQDVPLHDDMTIIMIKRVEPSVNVHGERI